jgi:hypothetical protein
MSRCLIRLALFSAVLGLASSLAAQAPAGGDPVALPICAEQGLARMVVMIPPGKSADEISASIQSGGLLPAGGQVVLIQPGALNPIANAETFRQRIDLTLNRFLEQGIIIDGSLSILLKLNEDGEVTEVHPNSGDPEVNRLLTRTWRQARFVPYAVEGCRAPAWVQVPQNFRSEQSGAGVQVTVDSNPEQAAKTPPPPWHP